MVPRKNILNRNNKTLFRDDKGRKFDEQKFLEGQSIQPFVVELEKQIKSSVPKIYNIMNNRSAVLKECLWPEYAARDFLIFKENIFANKSEEANLIWSEVKQNVVTHIEQMIDNPIKWTIKNRFWLNSAYACEKLGLSIHKDNKKYDLKGKFINI